MSIERVRERKTIIKTNKRIAESGRQFFLVAVGKGVRREEGRGGDADKKPTIRSWTWIGAEGVDKRVPIYVIMRVKTGRSGKVVERQLVQVGNSFKRPPRG
jgi:hypothetical protein